MGENFRKIMSGLFTTSNSKMTLDEAMKFLNDLKSKGVPGDAVMSLVVEVDGTFSEFGGFGAVNINLSEQSHVFINLKR